MELMFVFNSSCSFSSISIIPFLSFSCAFFAKKDSEGKVHQVQRAVELFDYLEKLSCMFSVFEKNQLALLNSPVVKGLQTLHRKLDPKKDETDFSDADNKLKQLKDSLKGLTADQMEFFQQVS